jgi:hypothetical protein
LSTRLVPTPTSRVHFGHARTDVTPPVGIYHRMWGAARHDRATGVHRPLYADVVAFGDGEGGILWVQAYVDGVGLAEGQDDALRAATASAAGTTLDRVVFTYSHTHAGGLFWPDRISLPGGELIPAYLEALRDKLASAAREAVARLAPATISYASGKCDLAANRDYWDDELGVYACGYNPDAPADDTVVVARVDAEDGQTIATVVNYACHPTTLAWENTLISPDYVGTLRDEVDRATGAPCVFAQGACGDLGPRHGYVGDPSVADRNGQQLAHAALSALAALGPPGTDFAYAGPVISGATLGAWEYVPQTEERVRATRRTGGGGHVVDLPLKPIPSRDALERDLATWEAKQRAADALENPAAARDFGARAERARRWLGRLATLPKGPTYPLRFSTLRLGDAFWVTVGGEPYNLLQTEVRRRFPDRTVIVSPLAGGLAAAYLLPRDRYGKGLYQEEPSSLGPGCLEELIAAVSDSLSALRD